MNELRGLSMPWKTIAAVSFSLLHPIAAHSEPMKVFGLPLGGIPEKPVKSCPKGFDNRPNLCWTSAPFVHKDGGRRGYVSIPDKDLPAWASHGMFEMSLTPKGSIASLTVKLGDPDDPYERCDIKGIVSSVTARFGKPTEDRLQEIYKRANWELHDIVIQLEVAEQFCSVSFRTPEDLAAQRAFNASQKVVVRPRTP